MRAFNRQSIRFAVHCAGVVAALAALAIGLGGIRVSRADLNEQPSEIGGRQLTVVAIRATPDGRKDGKAIDPKLASIKTQLERLMPAHGFKLLDVQSKRIAVGDSVECDLRGGHSARVSIVGAVDDEGKVPIRYELLINDERQISRIVKSPLNQLFFCERERSDGSKLLLAIGVR